ncbi:MAG: hypothetical protein BAJALOKI3v1_50121 [Promethearchaeota archaeon]|nr:MAG: hypothetical protein BAJALOKI3v1_50121 [Candidatus Lokiarchaeota archaeon]
MKPNLIPLLFQPSYTSEGNSVAQTSGYSVVSSHNMLISLSIPSLVSDNYVEARVRHSSASGSYYAFKFDHPSGEYSKTVEDVTTSLGYTNLVNTSGDGTVKFGAYNNKLIIYEDNSAKDFIIDNDVSYLFEAGYEASGVSVSSSSVTSPYDPREGYATDATATALRSHNASGIITHHGAATNNDRIAWDLSVNDNFSRYRGFDDSNFSFQGVNNQPVYYLHGNNYVEVASGVDYKVMSNSNEWTIGSWIKPSGGDKYIIYGEEDLLGNYQYIYAESIGSSSINIGYYASSGVQTASGYINISTTFDRHSLAYVSRSGINFEFGYINDTYNSTGVASINTLGIDTDTAYLGALPFTNPSNNYFTGYLGTTFWSYSQIPNSDLLDIWDESVRISGYNAAQIYKQTAGQSDITAENRVYKFMGCSLLSMNSTIGWNSVATSLSVTLVEDTESGDSFDEPTPPALYAISLPSGGIDAPLFYDNINLNPDSYDPSNTPFYFCGICSSWTEDTINSGGRTINVNMVDPREILSGVEVILGNWSLSHNFGEGQPRFDNVSNILDVFGFYDHGWTSNRNDKGMQWTKIQYALEHMRAVVFGINFEFIFTGEAFNDAPSWYRISNLTMDLISLITKIVNDGGSDLVIIARKVNNNTATIEFKAIRREDDNALLKTEITSFINNRAKIVNKANIGKEFKNEPSSKVIAGGKRNSSYVAYPTEYYNFGSGYDSFPTNITTRLFSNDDTFQVGSIFPFWGFGSTSGHPMATPFLPLDHIAFSREDIKNDIPLVEIETKRYKVRSFSHNDMFISNDGQSDYRPWCVASGYEFDSGQYANKSRGLPLNTEVLRAALVGEYPFYTVYNQYYPEIADRLNFPTFDTTGISGAFSSNSINLSKINVLPYTYVDPLNNSNDAANAAALFDFRRQVWKWVYEYAAEYMGSKFVVTLPYSYTMHRIWSNQSVPTYKNRPEIEYFVADRSYWETLPSEFDGLANGTGSGYQNLVDQEKQIIDRFMAEDGRFYPMVAIDWKPSGNANYSSNGNNRVMFQDLPTSEFAPNRIAEGNPDYIFSSADIVQIAHRPDLALVTLPSQISFDPLDSYDDLINFNADDQKTTWKIKRGGIVKWLNVLSDKDDNLKWLKEQVGTTEFKKALVRWSEQISTHTNKKYSYVFADEYLMDLKAVIIPLTSNLVTYGPWYYEDSVVNGMVDIDVDESLVPWNFERPTTGSWDANLDAAGEERLARSLSDLEYIDNASITVAGFPEYGLASNLGFNSNILGMAVTFDIGGITTTYNMSSYRGLPGDYRKSDYDQLTRLASDSEIKPTENVNFEHRAFGIGRNRFRK